jgi:uncharacterized membrane protein YbhN (UPF0104 family)
MSSPISDNEKEFRNSLSFRKVIVPVLIGALVAGGLLYKDISAERFEESVGGNYVWVDTDKNGEIDLNDAAEFIPVQPGTGKYAVRTYGDILEDINWTTESFVWLFCALLFTALRDIGYIFRIRHLTGNALSWKSGFNVIMLWEFASALTPSVVGGSGIAMFILNREKIPLGKSTATVMVTALLDELFYVIMVPVVFIFATRDALFPDSLRVEFFNLPIRGIFWVGYGVMVALSMIVSYAIFMKPRAFKYILLYIFRLGFLRKWRPQVLQVGDDIILASEELGNRNFRFWGKAGLATMLSWTSRFLVLNCIIAAFFVVDDHILLYARQLVMWVILLIGVTPGSSGIAEIAFGGFFKDFITVAGVGGALALIWRLFTYYIYMFIGSIVLPKWLRNTSGRKAG